MPATRHPTRPALPGQSQLFMLGDVAMPLPADVECRIAGRADLRECAGRDTAAAWSRHAPRGAAWLVDGRERKAALNQLERLVSPALSGAHGCNTWMLWLSSRCVEGSSPAIDEVLAWQHGADHVLYDSEAVDWDSLLQRLYWGDVAPLGKGARLRRMQLDLDAVRASLDNIPAPIFIKNASGTYTECNRAFQQFLGLSREAIVGKTVHDVAPPAQAAIYAEADRKLLAAGGRQVYDSQVRWADGTLRDVTFYKAVFHDAEGRAAGQAGAIFDITDQRHLEQRLRTLADTDPLTGLLNRRSFIERASLALERAASQGAVLTMIMFDLDHFKLVNDRHGHAAGDALLRHVADVVRRQIRGDDLFARLGGDEFAIVLSGEAEGIAVARRLPQCIADAPLAMTSGVLSCRISLGAALLAPGIATVDSAVRQADAALYSAKRNGRNQSVFV